MQSSVSNRILGGCNCMHLGGSAEAGQSIRENTSDKFHLFRMQKFAFAYKIAMTWTGLPDTESGKEEYKPEQFDLNLG